MQRTNALSNITKKIDILLSSFFLFMNVFCNEYFMPIISMTHIY